MCDDDGIVEVRVMCDDDGTVEVRMMCHGGRVR